MKFWKKCYSVGFLLILSPFKINIKHCATEFQLCKQQRPEDIGSQVVDIYPNWVKVSMFLAAYLYALPTNFLFDFHTSPLISPHISKMHTGKHSSIFASFCLIFIYFTKSQHVATSSFFPVGNHQATDTKINKLTIIVLESADPYLPDRVEFKHTSLLNLRQDMLFVRAAAMTASAMTA